MVAWWWRSKWDQATMLLWCLGLPIWSSSSSLKITTVTQTRAWTLLQNTCPEKESIGPKGNEPESYCLKDESDGIGHIVTETQLTHLSLIYSTWLNAWHIIYILYMLSTQSCLTLCNLMDCSPPVHVISQTKILERVGISYPRGSSQPRDRTLILCIGRQILYH